MSKHKIGNERTFEVHAMRGSFDFRGVPTKVCGHPSDGISGYSAAITVAIVVFEETAFKNSAVVLIPFGAKSVPSSRFRPWRRGTLTNSPFLTWSYPDPRIKSPSMPGEERKPAVTELLKMELRTSTGTWRRQSKVSVALVQFAAAVMLS